METVGITELEKVQAEITAIRRVLDGMKQGDTPQRIRLMALMREAKTKAKDLGFQVCDMCISGDREEGHSDEHE